MLVTLTLCDMLHIYIYIYIYVYQDIDWQHSWTSSTILLMVTNEL